MFSFSPCCTETIPNRDAKTNGYVAMLEIFLF